MGFKKFTNSARQLKADGRYNSLIVAKFINCTAGTLLTGHDVPTALRVGAGMAQIGEFAYIIAALGLTHPLWIFAPIGVLAIGGFALGGVALGGGAVAAYLAVGGLAIAGKIAIGGLAFALAFPSAGEWEEALGRIRASRPELFSPPEA